MRIFIINIAIFCTYAAGRARSLAGFQEDHAYVDSHNVLPTTRRFHRSSPLMETLSVSAHATEKRQKKKPRSGVISVRGRLAVASRVLAALIGGYLLTALTSICLAQFLPLVRAEAVVLAMTRSFLVYLPAVLWCFACGTAWRAWFGLLLPSAVLAALYAGARWLL
jgi:hypothetical protein